MNKDLMDFLGFDENEVITKKEDTDSDKTYNNINKTLKVKIFSAGVLTNETINKYETQSTEYNEFINLKEVEFKALKNNEELLCETDLVLLIGEYEDTIGMAKLEYIIQQAQVGNIKTVLLLSTDNDMDNSLIKEISTKADVIVPIIDKKVQQYEQNAYSSLDKNNLKAELAEQYINTILEFAPKCVSIFEPLDIIGTFTHQRGLAYVSSASASGKGKAEKAAALALSNVYSFKNYKDCKILLLTFSGGASLGLLEINDAAQLIAEKYGDDETILFTVVIDESMGSEMRVSIVGI